MKSDVAKETFGAAGKNAKNWDIRGLATSLDRGIKNQMDILQV